MGGRPRPRDGPPPTGPPGTDDRDAGLERENGLTTVDVVSPELALVDPELRRTDIARLVRQAALLRPTRSPSLPAGASAWPTRTLATLAAPSPVAHRSRPRRVAQLGLLAGLIAAGTIVATVAARQRAADTPELLTRSSLNIPAPSRATVDGAVANDGAVLARELLELIAQRPSRLPRAFIEPSTGLAKPLQAVCDPASRGGYLCIVRLAHRPVEKLFVYHGANGFRW
jgi:hypothetical protein